MIVYFLFFFIVVLFSLFDFDFVLSFSSIYRAPGAIVKRSNAPNGMEVGVDFPFVCEVSPV